MVHQEEIWFQKYHVKWLNYVDMNSYYFHSTIVITLEGQSIGHGSLYIKNPCLSSNYLLKGHFPYLTIQFYSG